MQKIKINILTKAKILFEKEVNDTLKTSIK